MVVWGGDGVLGPALNTGARYNPGADSWTATATTDAPSGRAFNTAAWTGTEMIICGSDGLNTGGRYNPNTDTWIATNTSNAPDGRYAHTAVWTSSEMIIWGGENPTFLNTGGRYCAGTPSQLGNISTRSFVQMGDNVMIGGFIAQGTQSKRVIIRAPLGLSCLSMESPIQWLTQHWNCMTAHEL